MIKNFSGEYAFLNNFAKLPGGATVEHYFQAAKATTHKDAMWILKAASPGEAKRRGHSVQLRDDWESAKLQVMLELLRKKFEFEEFRKQLLATGEEQLVEVNNWGDKYWGVCKGVGCNWLGKLLEQVRSEIRNQK